MTLEASPSVDADARPTPPRLVERKLLADIVEATDAFVQVADPQFRWLALNKAAADEFERIYGRRPQIGACMLDLLDDQPEQQEAVRRVWARALAGEQFTETAEFGDPGRERRCYEMKYNVLRDAHGRAVAAYQFVYDVTERVREQERLALAEEQLRHAQKMEAIGHLTGGVAHDFNNLLTIIRSSVDLLRKPDLPEARRQKYIEAIGETADRAAKLTGQLLAFARRQPLESTVFDVGRSVERTLDIVRSVVGQRVQISLSPRCAAYWVETDQNQFETALINLAVNARDAMAGGGKISVAITAARSIPATRGQAAVAGGFVAISLSDTGPGIAAGDLGRIFEPFFTTKEVGRGTGLGLSQVYGFAKQSGGEVTVESTPGEGATFTVYLPRANAPDRAAAAAPANEVEGAAARRILLVEDNQQVGDFAAQLLNDLGYTTTWVEDAASALGAIGRRPDAYDLIFSDVVMPGSMDGLALAHEIRRRWPRLAIVLTSGYSHVLSESGSGGFALLRKPYSVEALSELMRGMLQARS